MWIKFNLYEIQLDFVVILCNLECISIARVAYIVWPASVEFELSEYFLLWMC